MKNKTGLLSERIEAIKLDDYQQDAISHAYDLAWKLNEVIEALNKLIDGSDTANRKSDKAR